MSLAEIKAAIAELPPDERRALVSAFRRTVLKLDAAERAEIRRQVDETSGDEWVDWEVLKAKIA